jgi:sulfate transport system ATP-binding protein
VTIVVEDVSKRFGNFQAVDQVSMNIGDGSLVALLGPSGSGKSTLLRLIAGLEKPDTGRIWIFKEDSTNKNVKDRNIGFVFQHYALFKHLTVRQNIAFGLEIRKAHKVKIKAKVEELLDLIQLQGLGDRYPSQLSGGQRQRVALARALAVEPKVLLLDEPFGALDANVRKDLRAWLRRLHDEIHVTTVFVTHDQEEAMEIADEVVVMNHGKIEQIGSPATVYDYPASPFVMKFMGSVNVLPRDSSLLKFSHLSQDQPEVFLRPHDVIVETQPDAITTPARVKRITHMGSEIQVELRLDDGQRVNAVISRQNYDEGKLSIQQTVYIKLKGAKEFPFIYSI